MVKLSATEQEAVADELDALQTRVGVEFLIDDLTGPFQSNHLRSSDTELLPKCA